MLKENKLINLLAEFSNGDLINLIIVILLILIALFVIAGFLLRNKIIIMKANNQTQKVEHIQKKYIPTTVNFLTFLLMFLIAMFLIKFLFN